MLSRKGLAAGIGFSKDSAVFFLNRLRRSGLMKTLFARGECPPQRLKPRPFKTEIRIEFFSSLIEIICP